MNIVFIAHYPHLYGSIRSTIDLAKGLMDLGMHTYFVLPGKGSCSSWLEEHDIPFEILPIPLWVSEVTFQPSQKYQLFKKIFQTSQSLLNLIRRWDIDVVYTITSVTPVGRLAAQLAGLPHIWHIREFGDLDFSLQYVFPKPLCQAYIRHSDAVICHAKAVKAHHFQNSAPNIHQVYNGVATKEQFEARLAQRQGTVPNDRFTFAMLSAITHKKGQENAIKAMGSLKDKGVDANLLIAGSGKPDYLQQLNQLVTDLGINDRVEFTGFVADPYPLYYASDCALICSEHEALSRVGLEAMSTALPLIGRNSGGNPEIIRSGETGFLYNTFEELVDAMTCMVQNPELGWQMGLAGWEMAIQRFNIEDYASGVYRVIQSVMKEQA